jgi:hypothetical protein
MLRDPFANGYGVFWSMPDKRANRTSEMSLVPGNSGDRAATAWELSEIPVAVLNTKVPEDNGARCKRFIT